MPVTEAEYLATLYRPDCDFIDGILVERNVGLRDHSSLLGDVLGWFRTRRRQLGIAALPSQRIRVGSSRYRIPDVCVVKRPEPDEQIFTKPPYICIEILSPEDSFCGLQARFDDYLNMGLPNIWVLDPASQSGWIISRAGHLEALNGILITNDGLVTLPIAELFPDEID